MRMRGTGAALAFGVLLTVSGCGGEASPAPTAVSARPSVDAIVAALLEVGDDAETSYTPQEADCIARILVASDLSDDALQGVAEGVPGFEQSEADKSAYRKLVPEISGCLVGSLPPPSGAG